MLPSKFGVNWPFGSREEAKNRFSRWLPWWPFWIFDQHDFSYFVSASHPNAFQQDGGHLGFLIGTILAIFDLQVTPMLLSKFGVNWPFGSGEEGKNRFSRWWPSWISYQNDFSYF